MGILSTWLVRLLGRTRRGYYHDYKSRLDSDQRWHLSTKPSEGWSSSPRTNWWQSSHSEINVTGSAAPHASPWCFDLYKIWRSHSSHISIFTGITTYLHGRHCHWEPSLVMISYNDTVKGFKNWWSFRQPIKMSLTEIVLQIQLHHSQDKTKGRTAWETLWLGSLFHFMSTGMATGAWGGASKKHLGKTKWNTKRAVTETN